jgi:hypothetical protein
VPFLTRRCRSPSDALSGAAGVKIIQHVQEDLVQKSVLLHGDEQGPCRIIFGLDAALRVVLFDVEKATCIITRG